MPERRAGGAVPRHVAAWLAMKDTLFSAPQPAADFTFNAAVASVFDDMIRRSVPGYGLTLAMIGLIAREHAQPGSWLYDLGCSLGAATLTMRHAVEGRGCHILAIDNSPAMLTRCRSHLAEDDATTPVALACADIADIAIENASLVVLNFTLQFIPAEHRQALLARIHAGLRPGGVLLLSEKIRFDDAREQDVMTGLHHGFKRAQGYSDLEVSQKRTALENVLIPETLDTHLGRLRAAGFSQAYPWFQCFNFASLIAYK
jgi:tRNA (cmo5U34)-methyltransferase